MMYARERYSKLAGNRSQFLTTAVECSQLTLPYLVQQDLGKTKNANQNLIQPRQSVGANAVVTLAAK